MNGLKVRDHAVWVTNFTQGTLHGSHETLLARLDQPTAVIVRGDTAYSGTDPNLLTVHIGR